MTEPEEFWPKDRWPQTLIPHPGWLRRLRCRIFGHDFKKFLWGGIDHPFDCDCCTRCHRMRGPLPLDRETETYPCYMKDY